MRYLAPITPNARIRVRIDNTVIPEPPICVSKFSAKNTAAKEVTSVAIITANTLLTYAFTNTLKLYETFSPAPGFIVFTMSEKEFNVDENSKKNSSKVKSKIVRNAPATVFNIIMNVMTAPETPVAAFELARTPRNENRIPGITAIKAIL